MRILSFIFLIIIIASIGIYLLSKNRSHNLIIQNILPCTESGAKRKLLQEGKWQYWWPGKVNGTNNFAYKQCNYRIDNILLNGFDATVFCDRDSAKLELQISSSGVDSAAFDWRCTSFASKTPLKKILTIFQKDGLMDNVKDLIEKIDAYFSNEENIYGIKIIEQQVSAKDTALISKKQFFHSYPSTKEIYEMISSVQNYINQMKGKTTNYPMLNIHTDDSINYEVMVAIPTETDLQSRNPYFFKRMVLGNILMSEVKGGIPVIENGEQQMENYVQDHQKLSPAIPFQSLVTNRILEADSSKWITRLYYPVFN